MDCIICTIFFLATYYLNLRLTIMKKDDEIEKLLNENLNSIIEYTKGYKNLEEAKQNLRKSGFDDKAIETVLKDIERKNIIEFPKKR